MNALPPSRPPKPFAETRLDATRNPPPPPAQNKWHKVTSQVPCVACGKGDWCTVAPDGDAIWCGRSSDAPAGWHSGKRVDLGAVFMRDGAPYRRNGQSRTALSEPSPAPSKETARDWTADAGRLNAQLPDGKLEELARQLGVLPTALRQLGVGVASADELREMRANGNDWKERPPASAYAFPERDSKCCVIGISLRDEDGRKGFAAGGHRGLVIPTILAELPDPVLVVEGASDTAALISLGLAAVGRPSNSGGSEMLAELLRGREAVIVGERDEDATRPTRGWPGRDGAVRVATRLASVWRRPVRWTLPPEGAKDVREWLRERIATGLDLDDDDARRAAGAELLDALRIASEEVKPPIAVHLGKEKYRKRNGVLVICDGAEQVEAEDVLYAAPLRILNNDDCVSWVGSAATEAQQRAPWLGNEDAARELIGEALSLAVRLAVAVEARGKAAESELAGGGEDARSRTGDAPNDGRARIVWADSTGKKPLHTLTTRALEALSHTHLDRLFARGGALVRVLLGDTRKVAGIEHGGAPRISRVTEALLREALGESAHWLEVDEHGAAETWAPREVARVILDQGEWPGLRTLVGVVSAPTMRPDGSILDRPGYDDATGLMYTPAREYPPVPADPTKNDVIAAWRELLAPWEEFPFESTADQAAHAALLLTIVTRNAIEGPVPQWVLTAPSARTGKTLMANSAALAMTGYLPDLLPPVGGRQSDADAETRKRITALVIEGTRIALVDNQPDGSTYQSSALAAAITSNEWTDRILGRSERVRMPHRIIWIVSGNNISPAEDLAGRSLSIHLDAGIEDPGVTRTFRIPDPEAYARREHPCLLRAALTVLRGFVAAGRPGHGKPALGMFGEWDALVRSCIWWVTGLIGEAVDPLETQVRLRREAPDKDELRAVLKALSAAFPLGAAVKAQDMLAATAGRDDLTLALLAFAAGKDGKIDARRLGTRLRTFRGRVVDGLVLEEHGMAGDVRLWAVCAARGPEPRPVDAGSPGSPGSSAGGYVRGKENSLGAGNETEMFPGSGRDPTCSRDSRDSQAAEPSDLDRVEDL